MNETKDVTMGKEGRCRCRQILGLGLVLILMASADLPAGVATGQFIVHNTPGFTAAAQDLGPEDPSMIIDVTVWLRLHNRADLDTLATELYDPASSQYGHWLKRADFAAKFAPTAQEAKTVEEFLASHNLPVTAVGPENGFVRARGTVADVGKAFRVQINKFEVNGESHRANTTDPYVEGPAAALVQTVSGLDDLKFRHPLATQTILPPDKGGSAGAPVFETAASVAEPGFFTSHCFLGAETQNFTSNGTFPTATYRGNGYFSPNNAPGCGYTPPEIYTAYNLTGLYNEGYTGTGQTIVIIDFCGSPTILQDANTFSARFGLPALNSSNFQIINYPAALCEGLNTEINLDVEWAHAIAPGAKIDLLIAGSGTVQESDEAEYFAILSGLGNVISGSYGLPEPNLAHTELINQLLLNELAAVFGISANFSSGDSGDFTIDTGYFREVQTPASTPFSTAVGGVSLGLTSHNTIAFQTGWGENSPIVEINGSVVDPPFSEFIQGSGGGNSGFFGKPYFQNSLPGPLRQLPDISWLADPFTGGVIAYTIPGVYPPQVWSATGGTSLACPMFSALWAIANQEAGRPLGQAAPYLYRMPIGAITDVVPYGSATDVTATIHESSSQATHYTAAELAGPLEGTTQFYSVLYDYPQAGGNTFVLIFGTDSSLMTTIGWDNVTGLGTPNAKAFADYFGPTPAPISESTPEGK